MLLYRFMVFFGIVLVYCLFWLLLWFQAFYVNLVLQFKHMIRRRLEELEGSFGGDWIFAGFDENI